MASDIENRFGYFLSRNDKIMVVALSGELTLPVLELFEKCKDEIKANLDVQAVVLNFSDIRAITLDAIPALTHVQRHIREKGVDLRICSLSEHLKEKLVKLGVIRHAEIAEDLRSTLVQMNQCKKRAAA